MFNNEYLEQLSLHVCYTIFFQEEKEMAKIYYQQDCNLSLLEGKK